MKRIFEKTFVLIGRAESRICLCAIAVAVFLFSFFILFRAEWTMGDDYESLQSTAIGIAEPMSRHIGQQDRANGRFYPLGHFDLNILAFLPFQAGAGTHYAYILLQFLLIVFLLRKIIVRTELCGENRPFIIAFLMLLVILSPGFFTVFISVNYPERMIMLLLCTFVLLAINAIKKQNNIYFAMALCSAAYASYMKETVFLVFAVFAASMLFLNSKNSKKDRFFYCSLLVNASVFLIFYYFFAYRNHSYLYSSSDGESLLSFVKKYLFAEKMTLLIFSIAVIKLWKIISAGECCSFAYSLLFAAAAYNASFALLGFSRSYYFAPAVLLSIPAIAMEIKNKSRGIVYRRGIIVCCLAVIVLNIPILADTAVDSYVDRTTHMAVIRTIASHQMRGGRLYWYVPEKLTDSSTNRILLGQRHIYNVFLDYTNGIYNSGIVPGMLENFTVARKTEGIALNPEDVFIVSVYMDDKNRPMSVPDEISDMLAENGFALLRCNLEFVKVFMKKGSYVENNWLLRISS